MSAPPVSVAAAVPMSAPDLTAADVAAVVETLESGCLSLGPRLAAFERRVADLVGVRHAIGVSSGTAGLHLLVLAAGIGPDDLVVTTPFSFVASANCLLYERAIPVFVDVDPQTGNIDPSLVEQALADLRGGGAAARRWLPPALRGRDLAGIVKAILPVHAFGRPADMDPIAASARAHGVAIIEDACEAIGSSYKGRPAGAMGDAGVFAFYPNKQMTTGEGGMIVTDRDDWAAACRSLRNQGRDLFDAWLRHDRLGYNYRMDELSAALGLSQITRLDALIEARTRVVQEYGARLSRVPGVTPPADAARGTRVSCFAYVVHLDADLDRDRVMQRLVVRGVPSRPYFAPIHLQPFYARRFGYAEGDFPVAEALGRSCLALPFSGRMTVEQVEYVCQALAATVADERTGVVRQA
jgi:dTDP-4-amino-4,6-dideoxygalactose transaminase